MKLEAEMEQGTSSIVPGRTVSRCYHGKPLAMILDLPMIERLRRS